MSLTIGGGPFSRDRSGQIDVDLPDRVVFAQPLGRRLRAVRGGETVVDTDDAYLVHVTGRLPRYAVPAKDTHVDATPDPDLPGRVTVDWDAADAWFEEDERVLVHPRDPYHRIDTFATSRHVRVLLDGTVLADTTRATALHETGLPPRYYLPRSDVRLDLLVPSPTRTQCAYKGSATHWSARVGGQVVEDVAWGYEDEVRREGEAVRGLLAFYDERVDTEVDGVITDRPRTMWSR